MAKRTAAQIFGALSTARPILPGRDHLTRRAARLNARLRDRLYWQ
ncbi:hypothetical protein [Nonomuraea sp. NPDC049695]